MRRLPRALSRSSSRAAAGSARSGSSASPARASTGATASTGSMPRLPPDSRGTAEYLRSSQNATTPRASRATSSPARAAVASVACLPRRSRAAPGVTGRSAGRTTTAMTSTAITAAGHHAPPDRPRPSRPIRPATGGVREAADRHQQGREVATENRPGQHAGHGEQGCLGKRGEGELAARHAARGQQRVLLLRAGWPAAGRPGRPRRPPARSAAASRSAAATWPRPGRCPGRSRSAAGWWPPAGCPGPAGFAG